MSVVRLPSDLTRLLKGLVRDVETLKLRMNGVSGEAWRQIGAAGQPTFANGWVHYDHGLTTPSTVPGHRNAEFYKHNGRVHVQGVIRSGTVGQHAFVLPEGYRPKGQRAFIVLSNSTSAYVTVETDGRVLMASVTNTYVFLDAISFRAEQ